MTSPSLAPEDAYASRKDGSPQPKTSGQKAVKALLVLVVMGLLAMWIYAFGFASEDAIAKVSDTSWSKRAGSICEQRTVKLKAMAAEARTVADGTPQALGTAVNNATDVVEASLNEVLAVQPSGIKDRELIAEFERLYRIYLEDRRSTTDKLLNGQLVELNETLENGAPVSKIIADFTSVNRMDSCQVPPQF
jgi:hypothetical protein